MKRWSRKFVCCVACHTTERKHHAKGLCKKCYHQTPERKTYEQSSEWKANQKAYAQSTKGKVSRKVRQKRYDQTPKGKANRKKYIQSPKYRLGRKIYAEDNRVKYRAWIANYQARKKGNGGEHTGDDIKFLFNLSNYQCLRCGEIENLAIDHIVPVSKGGRNDILNLQVLCRSCNSGKSNIRPSDYRSNEFKQAVSRYAYGNIALYGKLPLQLEPVF